MRDNRLPMAVGVARRLCTFTTEANLPLTGGETIRAGEDVVSLVTSAAWGPTVGRTILRGYLAREHWDREAFTLEVFGERHAIRQVEGPLYDPRNERLKG